MNIRIRKLSSVSDILKYSTSKSFRMGYPVALLIILVASFLKIDVINSIVNSAVMVFSALILINLVGQSIEQDKNLNVMYFRFEAITTLAMVIFMALFSILIMTYFRAYMFNSERVFEETILTRAYKIDEVFHHIEFAKFLMFMLFGWCGLRLYDVCDELFYSKQRLNEIKNITD